AEINNLACIEVDLTTSVRQIAANIGIGRESVRNILKKHKFKPFKYQVHYHLYEADHQRRLEYWARENPDLFRQGAFQERFGVKVWMEFSNNEIADFLENLSINEYFHIYYQQDGNPAHNALRLDGQLGPAISLPQIFFYWGHIKEAVYRTQPTDLQGLRDRITRAVNNITPAQMENVLREFKNKINLCHQMNGGQFKHLIYG
ncbi:hypothetical protein NQ318_007753, partial [Aromia moschata]